MNTASEPRFPEPSAVTFIAPAQHADARRPSLLFSRRPAKTRSGLRIADEDGARRALGGDGGMPAIALSGASIEHLARIALG